MRPGRPVDRVAAGSAQPVVPDPGRMRHLGPRSAISRVPGHGVISLTRACGAGRLLPPWAPRMRRDTPPRESRERHRTARAARTARCCLACAPGNRQAGPVSAGSGAILEIAPPAA
jgi:hypothetical protein